MGIILRNTIQEVIHEGRETRGWSARHHNRHSMKVRSYDAGGICGRQSWDVAGTGLWARDHDAIADGIADENSGSRHAQTRWILMNEKGKSIATHIRSYPAE